MPFCRETSTFATRKNKNQMALSKNRIKYIRSLELKKNRKTDRVFLAEGPKVVGELLGRFHCRMLVATPAWLQACPTPPPADETHAASAEELSKASLLKTPQQVLAVFEQPADTPPPPHGHSLCLALDDVQDPGNVGTIIRLADWFGIERIYCSPNTADVYNPKTVQATMGAIARVRTYYTPLPGFLRSLQEAVPVYGTFLDGEDIYGQPLSAGGVIVMGNEGNGISEETARYIPHRLYIPSYPSTRPTSESLNVAMATAIVCAEFRRRATCL